MKTYKNLWDTAKTMLRGEIKAVNTYTESSEPNFTPWGA